MLLLATSRRFIAAPNLEREVETPSIAVSMALRDESAAPADAPPIDAASTPDNVSPPMVIAIWSDPVLLRPTCRLMVNADAPTSSMPLNLAES